MPFSKERISTEHSTHAFFAQVLQNALRFQPCLCANSAKACSRPHMLHMVVASFLVAFFLVTSLDEALHASQYQTGMLSTLYVVWAGRATMWQPAHGGNRHFSHIIFECLAPLL
jgi:hypothetical protein